MSSTFCLDTNFPFHVFIAKEKHYNKKPHIGKGMLNTIGNGNMLLCGWKFKHAMVDITMYKGNKSVHVIQ